MLVSDGLSRGRTPVLLSWVALGIAVWLVFGPFYLRVLRPSPDRVTDYFQDWSSARNVVTGRPVYSEHAISLPLYLGLTANPDPRIARNAHPPTSVLLALPLARVPYPDAVLAWNLVSLAAFALSLVIVSSALRLSASVILPILAFCLFATHSMPIFISASSH
jgi:hypothetical protein